MDAPYRANEDIAVLPYFAPAPGLGFLPIHAFLVLGSEPVLIDTGIPAGKDDWLEMLWSLVEPDELRWVFLTHEDRDHSGGLEQVLETAPNARLVLNFVALAKLGAEAGFRLSPERMLLVNPGQSVAAGDRRFAVVKPPAYDSGATIGFVDEKSATFFAADAFGTLVPDPTMELGDIPEDAFEFGFRLFNMANSPWLATTDRGLFADTMRSFSALGLERILGTHLPVGQGGCGTLIERLAALGGAAMPDIPDDAAFRAILAQAKGTEAETA
jgi:glyoxylase-like metal-dependent hydrolase (beta-lactamase superfamily II)